MRFQSIQNELPIIRLLRRLRTALILCMIASSAFAQTAPVFTSSAPPDGTVGVAYSHTFAASGTAPIAFSLTGGLPPGLTFNRMLAARVNHTATLLASGKVLVVAGVVNVSSGGFFNSAELFDPANNTWSVAGSLAVARGFHTATLLANGKVLVTGGLGVNPMSAAPQRLASAELYDPATNTWSAVGSLAEARAHHSATLLANGKVLVAGGSSNNANLPINSAELFDPATNIWSAAGSFLVERRDHETTLLPDGRVLMAGGGNNFAGSLASADLYDPATNTWSPAGSLARARNYLTLTLLGNGKILAVGGFDQLGIGIVASAELYDPLTNIWSAAGSLGVGRYDHTATRLSNGQVLVAGGFGGNFLASAELYDPASNSWSATGSLATARQFHTATALANGNVLAAGGLGMGNANINGAEFYDIATNTWQMPGVIFGTPTSAGNYSFSVQAANGTPPNATQSVSLLIGAAAPPPVVATAIAAGRYHTCAVVGGGVRCWGGNQSIQLGTSLASTNIPITTIPLASGATAIAAGDSHTCAVVQGGVRCWGSNNSGQIAGGSGGINAVSFPVQTILAGSGATAVAAGAFHSCAIVNGGVLCWGDNRSGQLGTGDTQQPSSPAQVIPAGSGVVAIAAGQTQTCAVFSSGLVKCWGTFLNGETFQGRQIPSTILSPIGMAYGNSVAAGVGFNHACTAGTGGVRCAGINTVGQLGVTGLLDNPAPGVALAGNSISVGAGNSDTCAEYNGGVKCWGLGFYGALGNGTSGAAAMSDIPVDAILAGNGVSAVAVGVFHVCAIANGAVKCWGYNSTGQLGDGSNVDRVTPVDINLFPAPVFSVTPLTLSFSSSVGMTSAVQTVTVSNAGTASLNLFSFDFTGNFSRAIGANAGSCETFAPMPPPASCTIGIVFNASLAGASSGTLTILHNAPGSPTSITLNGSGIPPLIALTGVVSRKDHGTAGTFDLPIDTGVPITGAVTVEPRVIGAQHRIVFAFNATVTAQGSVTVVNSAGQALPASLNVSAGEVIVSLSSVPDNSRIFITLSGVNSSAGGTAAVGFLVGDVNNTRSVNSSDISGVKARSGQATTASNFKFDVNASGVINSSDISAVKARSGLTLP